MLSDIMVLYIGHIKRKYYKEKLMTYNDIVEKYEQSIN